MRTLIGAVLALTFFLGTAVPAEAQTLRQRADQVMFGGNGDFMKARSTSPKAGSDTAFNWSSDDCSVPTAVKFVVPATGVGSLVFSDQCKHHDFGWRNYGNGIRLSRTAATKRSIDSHFGSLMQSRWGTWWIRYTGQEVSCRLTAGASQAAVTVAPW